jgi:hypothetical protein
VPAPLASWNPARDAWETSHSHIDLFSELSAVYSETWPSWGMTRAGVAYELPTSAPPTAGSACSSSPGLLPTPEAYEGTRGGSQHPDKHRAGGHSVCLQDVAEHMLPTPQARDWKGVGPADHQRNDPGLPAVAEALLPTPRATDGTKGGPNQRGSSGDLMLPSAVMLLPTPSVADAMGGHLSRSGSRSSELLLPGVAKAIAEARLLPTPTTMDSKASGGSSPSDVTLTDAVVRTSLGATTNPRFAAGSD